MGLPRRQLRVLRQTEAEFARSEPALASKMAIFAALAASEKMPGHERRRSAIARAGHRMLAVTAALLRLAARAAAPVSRLAARVTARTETPLPGRTNSRPDAR